MSALSRFPTESIESSSNLASASNLDSSNFTMSEGVSMPTPSRSNLGRRSPESRGIRSPEVKGRLSPDAKGKRSPDAKSAPSAVSSSADHNKLHSSGSQRSHSKDRFDKDGVWSAIDTLDDVRKMALENKNKDVFPPGFEANLDISRDTNAKLLHIIKDRADRIAQDIRTSRDLRGPTPDGSKTNLEGQRRRKGKKSLGKSLSRKNIARMVDKLESRTNSNNTNASSNSEGDLRQNSNSYLSVNLGQYSAYNSSMDDVRYNSSESDSSDENENDSDNESSFSDASSAIDPSVTASQRRLPHSGNPTNPVYISDYTDYQANITEIAATEVDYVTALIATIRTSSAEDNTNIPKETQMPDSDKFYDLDENGNAAAQP